MTYQLTEPTPVEAEAFRDLLTNPPTPTTEEALTMLLTSDPLTLAALEKLAILAAFKACGDNLTKTCRKIGIGRTTLYRKLIAYGVKQSHAKT